jgi:gliding motility-associated peptidyl-prolyl isomerase
MYKNIFFLFLVSLIVSCNAKQEPRRPISQSSGEFMKESIERNKKLIKTEELAIANLIKNDTTHKYITSNKGFWYFYTHKNEINTSAPKKGDIVLYDYEILDLKGDTIYSQKELKTQQYVVDKQDIMIGLQDGIKLMQKGEKATFLLPSHKAYGYHGDNNKIGINVPLICNVTIKDVKTNIIPVNNNK